MTNDGILTSEFVKTEGVTAVRGAEDVIGLLHDAGVEVALTTGFSPATTRAIVAPLEWEDLVDVVLSTADAGRGRPYPDLPLTALLRTGASSVESMVVIGSIAELPALLGFDD